MIISSLAVSANAIAEGPVCHKCEKVREYNAAHPENNYEWYDDYLKDKEAGKAHEKKPEVQSDATQQKK